MSQTHIRRRAGALAAGLATLLAFGVSAQAAEWIAGHSGPNGRWIAGQWAGGVGPAAGPAEGPPPGAVAAGRVWAPGLYNARRVWMPGHWVVR